MINLAHSIFPSGKCRLGVTIFTKSKTKIFLELKVEFFWASDLWENEIRSAVGEGLIQFFLETEKEGTKTEEGRSMGLH